MAEQTAVRVRGQPRSHAAVAVRGAGVSRGLLTLGFIAAILAIMSAHYTVSATAVVLSIDAQEWQVRTHQKTVGAFLREMGVDLEPADIVIPTVSTPLEGLPEIKVHKALHILVDADGQLVDHYTYSRLVGDLLQETGLSPGPYDLVTLDGKGATAQTVLPRDEWQPQRWPLRRLPHSTRRDGESIPLRLRLQRAVVLSINDEGTQITVNTVARTIGEALLEQNIVLYLGDRVQPALGSLLTAGLHVQIHRATPVSIMVDGRSIRTRTQASNVAQLLSDATVILAGKDYVVPGLDAPVEMDMIVRVVRVAERMVLESENIAYATIVRYDSELELDQRRVDQQGILGIKRRQTHIGYEDGVEISRTVADEWVERQPTAHVVSYGTKIVVRELETPDGVIRYWRKIRMLATSYTAADGGKPRDHPQYGITRIGWLARRGIVAVDPTVVKLLTRVYVPGYGPGVAADTGGGVKGRWIDLCYEEGELVLWWKWVDVYLLEPVPPSSDINYVLPNYPVERR
jgi:uncharacterized protein YabE (DUF348 family)